MLPASFIEPPLPISMGSHRFALLLLPLLGACGGSSGVTDTNANDALVRFDYAGQANGSVTARGDGGAASWARATAAGGKLTVEAGAKMQDGTYTVVELAVEQWQKAETVHFGSTTPCGTGLPCATGGVSVAALSQSMDSGEPYTFIDGAVRFTRTSGGRAQGTFAGKASGFVGQVQVNGTFDLPVR